MKKTKITEATEKGQEYGDIRVEPQNAVGVRIQEAEDEMIYAGWKKNNELVEKLFNLNDGREARAFVYGDRAALLSLINAQNGTCVLIELESTLKNAIEETVRDVKSFGHDWIERSMELSAEYVFNIMIEMGWRRIDSVPQIFDKYIKNIQERFYFENEEMYAVVGKIKQTPTCTKFKTTMFLTTKNGFE